jgi:hypothetical protein
MAGGRRSVAARLFDHEALELLPRFDRGLQPPWLQAVARQVCDGAAARHSGRRFELQTHSIWLSPHGNTMLGAGCWPALG